MNVSKGNRMPKWMLIVCVAAPILGLILWILILDSNSTVTKLLPYALFLLCPLSHFLMMPFMHKTRKNHDDEAKVIEIDSQNESSCH